MSNNTKPLRPGIFSEFFLSCSLWRFTFYSAIIKITLRNAGAKLGLLWEPLSTLIVSTVLSLVWIKVLGVKESFFDYFAYVYCGMVIWGGLASAVSNLCATLVKNARNITTRTLPIFTYIFEEITISYIPFLLSAPILVLILGAGGSLPTLSGFFVFILGFALMLVASFAFSISIGLGAFFIGDLRQIITAVMRLSFLVTPVIWRPERLGDAQEFLLLNPFYGYLHIMRSGLLGQPVKMEFVVQAVGLTTVIFVAGIIIYAKLKNKIQSRALRL